MLREALKYLSLGLSVIPVAQRGKEPLVPWKEYQTKRPSPDEVVSWFTKWPDANVGVVTGAISSCVIVDLDGHEGLASARRLGLSSPCSSITGRGKHLWYQHPNTLVTNAVKLFPGLDIRADGGFVLAPPSVHPNGKRYRWCTKPLTGAQLPSLPDLFITKENALETLKNGNGSSNAPGWISTALQEMTNGNIDDTLFKICSRFRNDGLTKADVYTLISPHAERVGATEGHLQDKIDNVWGRYEPRVSNTLALSTTNGQLILHSPNNADSVKQYNFIQMAGTDQDSHNTGYPKFDSISKGLKAGEVLTVAARTGVGKTNWIITPIRTFCEAGKRVLLFSTEMSFDQIWQRYISTLIRREEFDKHSFVICDEFTPDIARIEEAIRRVKPDLFIFDHISHIGTDYHIISKFMSEIKRLIRLFNIPGIVTAQLNRNADWVEQGERVAPRMSMIQGSGAIEQISGAVLLLSEKRVNADYTEIDGVIDKNRHGDKGLIKFGLFKNPYRIEEL